MRLLRHHLVLFLNALRFYTRVPVPAFVPHSDQLLNEASLYFPVVGWLVGGVAAAVLVLFSLITSPLLAVLLSTVATIWLTGAFHEDGFADSCDGFGGGWTRAQILSIMKDSRLGTYGTLGLGLLLSVKVAALLALPPNAAAAAVLVAHPLSRVVALSFVRSHRYVRDTDDAAKAKPVAQGISRGRLTAAAVLGILPLALLLALTGRWALLGLFGPVLLVRLYLSRLFGRWLGGYTGDCLGATQQLSEVAMYLSFSILWKYC